MQINRLFLSRLLGPAYVVTAIAIFLVLHQAGLNKVLVYYLGSLFVILLTQTLEILVPYEKSWRWPDDQFLNELGHTFISAMLGHNLGRLVAYGAFGLLVSNWNYSGAPWWPTSLPFAFQVILAFCAWEFGLYWNHRLMHGFTWRFHALHHKLRRLSWANSGYGHPMQFVMTSFFDLSVLLLLGVPAEVMMFTMYLSGAVNFLPHANIDMKMGLLNYVFATPEVHRWHHEKSPESGTRNFGMQLIVWDLVFGTYFNSKSKPSPRILGDESPQPAGFFGQWLAPIFPGVVSGAPKIPDERRRFQFFRR
jgi:ornithine lipid hydroxylase